MKKLLLSTLLLAAATMFAQTTDLQPRARMLQVDGNGVPTFMTGRLGKLTAANAQAAKAFLESRKDVLNATGPEEFQPLGAYRDESGQNHFRLQERLHGRPFIGAEYIVHADDAGNVVAMNGRFSPAGELPRDAAINGWSAIERAAEQAGISNAAWNAWPELVYVMNERGSAFLAWRATAAYAGADGEQIDIVYANALSGDLVMQDAQIQRARSRQTYNGNNTTTLPGTLVLSETSGSTSDTAIQAAHDYAGKVYDYYSQVHSRDSYNNAGATIRSTVHHDVSYNNAFWNGSQMVYGDGDGVSFTPLSKSFDVDAHELTHAVTDYSADLVYQNESGALNEGTSDIMASAADAWRRGVVDSAVWKIGEDVYTPGTSGDALRYMNDPAAAGDRDYYPTRYTGTSDYGGVHTNSGIANLAFYLMTMGGTHPRGKTTVNVPALSATATTSINMAGKIWYRALTVYMTSSTNFSAARTATAQAATDLYGATAANSVNKAWDAVGAPGGTAPPAGTTTLSNGVAVTGISGSTGTWKHYKIAVPSGQTKLDIVMSGGSGDADMYVKIGSQPTSSSYNYRPYLNGNNETVSVTNPTAGDWYISLYAYSSFSSVTLKATYTGSTGSTCTSVSGSLSGTGASYYSAQYASSVSGAHTGKLTGPSGVDFDLYLQKWNGSTWSSVAAGESSTATENVSYNGTAGTYRWRVYAYSGSGSFTLCTTKP